MRALTPQQHDALEQWVRLAVKLGRFLWAIFYLLLLSSQHLLYSIYKVRGIASVLNPSYVVDEREAVKHSMFALQTVSFMQVKDAACLTVLPLMTGPQAHPKLWTMMSQNRYAKLKR